MRFLSHKLLWLLPDILLLSALLIVSVNYSSYVGVTKRGFYCNDELLKYPYHKDTISSKVLVITCLHVPLLVIFAAELWKWRCVYKKCEKSSFTWPQLWPLYNTLRFFLFGYAARNLLTKMAKQMIGRLRPHFFAVCQPLLSDGGSCNDLAHRMDGIYHTNYTCQPNISNASEDMLRSVRVSFPSGHSSLAFYGMTFIALYLQWRTDKPSLTLWRPLCQLGVMLWAWCIALSRVLDYKHHWSDVVAGGTLGIVVAFVVMCGVRAQARKLQLQSNDCLPDAQVEVERGAPVKEPDSPDLPSGTCQSLL